MCEYGRKSLVYFYPGRPESKERGRQVRSGMVLRGKCWDPRVHKGSTSHPPDTGKGTTLREMSGGWLSEESRSLTILILTT